MLLVTPLEKSKVCAAMLQEATGETVAIADSLLQATTLLRAELYTAVIFDQNLMENEPHEIEVAFEHLGAAIPVQINFAISGPERLVRDLRAAKRRRQREEATARKAAAGALHGKVNETVTTLLLNCELALGTAGLPAATAGHLAAAYEMAQKLRAEIEVCQ